jgi:hypothetical protein
MRAHPPRLMIRDFQRHWPVGAVQFGACSCKLRLWKTD